MTEALVSQAWEGTTFDVSDVEPAAEPLPTVKTHQAVATLADGGIEACSDYTADCCEGVTTNPLVTAVQLAYSQHRPLVLSPDMIWLTILQGVTTHLEQHSAELAERFLKTPEQKKSIVFSTRDFPVGSPETPWGELVDECANEVMGALTPAAAELFSLEFSTTTPHERVARNLALLSGMRQFLSFLDAWAICGIPAVTLEGGPEDWRCIRQSIDALAEYDLDWWLERLRPVCDEFVNAAEGRPDPDHWRQIFAATESMCGNEWVSGWISDLFPYEKRAAIGYSRNRAFEGGDSSPKVTDFPHGLSEVQFASQRGTIVRLLGGFLGIEQDAPSRALRPRIGWAVRRQTPFEMLLDDISRSDRCHYAPGVFRQLGGFNATPKLKRFFARFDGLKVHSAHGELLCEFATVDCVEEVRRADRWLVFERFAWLPDGRRLGCRCAHAPDDASDDAMLQECFAFYLADDSVLEPGGTCQLISNDFEQVLRWIMESDSELLDKAPSFKALATVDPCEKGRAFAILQPLGRPD